MEMEVEAELEDAELMTQIIENAAHVEVKSVKNGVRIVKLMGRHSGNFSAHVDLI